jgi:hypothetical protein
MHVSPRRSALCMLLAGCGPDGVAGSGSTDAGSTTASSTTGETTGSEPTGAGSTAPTETGAGPGPTTGEPGACGCEDAQVFDGDLNQDDLAGLAGACIGVITGDLQINGVTDPAVLQPLVGLKRARGVQILYSPGLVDLSALGCLEEVVDRLEIEKNSALVDVSALTRVRAAKYVRFSDVPITALPSFAPDYQGVHELDLGRLPALVDLAPVAAWPGLFGGDNSLYLSITDVPQLTDIAGLAGPIGAPRSDRKVVLDLEDLPSLTALTGLEAMRAGSLDLAGLPQVTSLAPLAGVEQLTELYLDGLTGLGSLEGLHNLATAEDVRLTGMPGLTSLAGLGALESAASLQIGGCEPGEGLDGLADLTGLDVLTHVDVLLSIVRNAGLVALTGAPELVEVGRADVVDNSQLTADAAAAFDAQIETAHLCFGGEVECGCLGVPPDAFSGCPGEWVGGSAVTAAGEAGPLAGTTAFFAWTALGSKDSGLNLVIVDAAADLGAAKNDGVRQTSDAGTPKLVVQSADVYQDLIGGHTSPAVLMQPGQMQTQVEVHFTISERLGDWTMIDRADPPRLAGEFTALDPDAATLVEGPFEAVYCHYFGEEFTD